MARGVTYLLLTRPQFLLLTPACFVVGVATALLRSGPAALNSLHLLLALVGAVAAHIAVNVLNDYLDCRSGLDYRTQRTPFSGGSGLLPAGRIPPAHVLTVGLAALAVTIAAGIYLVILRGSAILWIGIPGLL